MSTISSQEVISIVKGEIEDYDAHAGRIRETGSVIWVGDGIAIVYGIDHAMYQPAQSYIRNQRQPGIPAVRSAGSRHPDGQTPW